MALTFLMITSSQSKQTFNTQDDSHTWQPRVGFDYSKQFSTVANNFQLYSTIFKILNYFQQLSTILNNLNNS